jgi:nucleotide-binding universal stress UspA family protein
VEAGLPLRIGGNVMKILLPLDGSKFAEAAIKPIVPLVWSSGAEVHLIQVVLPADATVDWTRRTSVEPHLTGDSGAPGFLRAAIAEGVGGVTVESRGQADERVRQGARDYLNSIANRFFPPGATQIAVTGDDPANEILNYARRENVDLIAIATHGRTGLARLMMGSVAAILLKNNVAPLLMVRPEGLKP